MFPHQKALADGLNSGLEEERRLAYVGITRAKKELYITYADTRRIFNEYVKSDPSRFISEINCSMLSKISSNSNYSNNKNYSQANKELSVSAPINKHKTGAIVLHQSFGKGVILRSNEDNIEIAFSQHGIKTIKKSFITLCD